MPDRDSLSDRGRSLEEDYFRKRDRELLEKMRQAAAADEARTDLSRKAGFDDPELLREMDTLGFTPETIGLLPLVPLIRMAWAEGGITKSERELILRLARSRGIEADSAADRRLSEWMTSRPSEAVLAGATRLIRAMIESGSDQTSDLTAEDLVRYCEEIASASGGILGMGRVSAEERALLSSIAADLQARRS